MSRQVRVLVAVVTLAFVATACGSSSKSSSSSSPSSPPTTAGSQMTGNVTVFAAASLTEAFNDLKTSLDSSDPDLHLTYNFAGSQALVTQIQNGAPADVFASADTKNMQKLVDDDLVETPQTFAKNQLMIAVAPETR